MSFLSNLPGLKFSQETSFQPLDRVFTTYIPATNPTPELSNFEALIINLLNFFLYLASGRTPVRPAFSTGNENH
jgi:hypothetical protein